MKKRNVMILVILLVVGFASVSTTLIINGVIGIASNESDFNIIFTNAKLNNVERKDFIDPDTKQTLTFETNKLTNLDEEARLDYEVTNASRLYDADVVINCNIVDEEENIIESNEYIVIGYEPKNMIVEAGKTESGSITARLFRVATEDQSIKIKCTLNANATERDTLGAENGEPFSKSGTLRTDDFTNPSDFWEYRTDITKVVFEDNMNFHETSEDLIFDVSDVGDGSVMSYLVPYEDDNTKYTLYIQSDTGVKANSSSSYLFYKFTNLKEIEGLKYFGTSNVANMSDMFRECSSLTTLDLSFFDTSLVKDMSRMFYGCSSLTTLDVSNFDTSNVANMSDMFYSCKKLTTLDVSNFDTSLVKDMSRMFYGCSSLTTLDVSNFDTSKVTNVSSMFSSCNNLTTLNVSNFDTSNVANVSSMFSSCSNLTTLDVSNFDTSKVTNMSDMFYGCSSLTTLDISNFDTSKVTSTGYMFYSCENLTTLDLSSFDTSLVKDMSRMFYGCSSLTTLDVSNFDISNVANVSGMFSSCSNLTTLDVSNFDTSNVTNMSGMFYHCNNLTTLDVSNFDTNNVINMKSMFEGCSKFTNLDLSSFDTSKVTNMSYMFSGCNNLTTLDISNFDTSKVTSTGYMFYAMRSSVIVRVKDKVVQDWIFALSLSDRPLSWTTENVIIA